ncbi:MAG: hypothetical protein JO071_01310 [Deltaproteobacteria bacterium]|nr:hypothetical protein [Deltaproteobacteria bacterium]
MELDDSVILLIVIAGAARPWAGAGVLPRMKVRFAVVFMKPETFKPFILLGLRNVSGSTVHETWRR